MGIPAKHGEYYYFSYNSGLQAQTPIYRIKEKNSFELSKDDPLSSAELFWDPNTLPEGQAPTEHDFSYDGKYLAYQVSQSGSDWNTGYVMDARSRKLLPEKLEWLKFTDIRWTRDSKGFFYNKFDIPKAY